MQDQDKIQSRVLVLAPTHRDFELTRDILKRAGVECESCANIADLCDKIVEGAGAALVAEEALGGHRDDALSRCLAAQPPWSDLPLLLLAGAGASSPRVASVMEKVGTVTVLERPVRMVILLSAIRSALRARARQYQVRDDAVALAEARDELELRVKERTAELRSANTQLERKIRETEAAERRARLLLRRLVSAQETERARIARDLHDELGQQLTSLRLHLSQLGRDIAADKKARETLAATEDEAEKIDSRVSFLAWSIRPTTIEELGLSRAMEGYLVEWSRNFGIPAEFRAGRPPRGRLLSEIEVNIYRIAQECLNNIAKYAQASTVSVLLSIGKKEVSLIVEDDGVGFDTEANGGATSSGGLGINGMRERATLLGGTFDLESAPKKGTTVYVRIPADFRDRSASSSDAPADVNGS